MLNRLRPNVILLALLVAMLTGYLAVKLIDRTEAIVSNEILALLVGVGIGGLVGVMSAVSQDPPPPTVPASTVEHLVDSLLEAQLNDVDANQSVSFLESERNDG